MARMEVGGMGGGGGLTHMHSDVGSRAKVTGSPLAIAMATGASAAGEGEAVETTQWSSARGGGDGGRTPGVSLTEGGPLMAAGHHNVSSPREGSSGATTGEPSPRNAFLGSLWGVPPPKSHPPFPPGPRSCPLPPWLCPMGSASSCSCCWGGPEPPSPFPRSVSGAGGRGLHFCTRAPCTLASPSPSPLARPLTMAPWLHTPGGWGWGGSAQHCLSLPLCSPGCRWCTRL